MAITFTNDRWFRTDVGHKIFQNVPVASQWFKIRVTSKSVMPSQTEFLSKIVFDFQHMFMGTGNATTIPLRFRVTNAAGGQTWSDQSLTLGVVYGIAITWDGVAKQQKLWISGIPISLGALAGNTQDNSSAMQTGIAVSTARAVFTLDDHNVWDNYLLTAADIAFLLGGGDPTTIVGSSTWRGRWTLAGTTGANAAIGDAGLKNAYGGGGSLASGGDGSDCQSAGGAGSAVYAPGLVWAPTVAPDGGPWDAPYIDTCGAVAVSFFKSLVNGSPTPPSQILTIPTISVGGVDHGALGAPWFPGGQPYAWFPLPSGLVVAPGDAVTLTAPTAWANTPAGSVEAMNNLPLVNRVGKSVVRQGDFVPTLPVGLNDPQGTTAIWGFYYPFKNWKMRTYGGYSKYTSVGPWQIYSNTGANGIDQTNYPGIPGLWLVMWDTGLPSNANQFAITSGQTATTRVTERTDLKASPPSGIGMCRVFDVQHVSLTGSANLAISLTLSGTINYDNLWIVQPGDFDIASGKVVLDRSDPWALGRTYLDRVPQNIGSLRWEDCTIGGNPSFLPFPENRRDLNWESWGDLASFVKHIGYTTVSPVNTTTTPYFYSPFLGRPDTNGEAFTVTLASPITTAPARGTRETWAFTDTNTVTLVQGLEIKVDSEIVRLLAQGPDVLHWVVYRGSGNTVPATHAAGPVTVYGRIAVTTQLQPGGARGGGNVWQLTTTVPHGITTGTPINYGGGGYPIITLSNGDTLNLSALGGGPIWVTGPNTFIHFVGTTKPSPGVLTAPVVLNPANQYWDQHWPYPATIPHEAAAIVAGKFPNANLHMNLWPDACDDMVCEVARRVRDNFPAGRKVYVEYNNEPWNFAFGGFLWHSGMMGPLLLPNFNNLFPSQHLKLAHYAWRAFRVHDLWREVFAETGRQDEIMGILNCQMGGQEAQDYLNYAISLGKAVNAIAIAPYLQNQDNSYNNSFVNVLSDAQVISMFVHDLWYNPGLYNAQVATDKGYIAAYNANSHKTGDNCVLLGYEGGIEFVIPNNTSIANREARNHDCITHPDWYIAEGDFYAWLQMQGFDHLHVYALAMFWNPQAWGMYHGVVQQAGRGDGSDGKLNNLLCRANPTSPQYKGANVNQDMNTVSVRGQALLDWYAAMNPPPQSGEETQWQGNWIGRWFRGKQGDSA